MASPSAPLTHTSAAARTREPAFRFAAETLRTIERAHRREFEERIDLQTAMMKAAKVQGHKLKLAAHYPGYLLWFVPDELIDEVGCQAAVVRA